MQPGTNNSSPIGRSQRILLGDDDESFRHLLAEVLEAEGFEVIEAENRKRAVEIYRQRAAEIGWVVFDMSKSRPSAEDALAIVRELNASAKVLLLTGNSKLDAVEAALHKGFNGFVPKPFTVAELLAPLRTLAKVDDCAALTA